MTSPALSTLMLPSSARCGSCLSAKPKHRCKSHKPQRTCQAIHHVQVAIKAHHHQLLAQPRGELRDQDRRSNAAKRLEGEIGDVLAGVPVQHKDLAAGGPKHHLQAAIAIHIPQSHTLQGCKLAVNVQGYKHKLQVGRQLAILDKRVALSLLPC